MHFKVFPQLPRWVEGYDLAASGTPSVVLDDEVPLEDGSRTHVRWSASPWGEPEHGKRALLLVSEVGNPNLGAEGSAALAPAADLVGALMSAISFDVRTPLQAILGMADLLWDSKLDPEQREFVQTVRRAGEYLQNRLDALLGLEEKADEEEAKVVYDLGELLERIGDLLAVRARPLGIGLARHVSHDVPLQIEGDPRALGQLLLYLGSVAVDLAKAGEVRIMANMSTAGGAIVVVDWGLQVPGQDVAAETRDHWLEAFGAAALAAAGGSGGTDGGPAGGSVGGSVGGTVGSSAGGQLPVKMGLQVATRLVSQLAGKLWATPALDGGLVIRFTTQLSRAEQARRVVLPAMPAQARTDERPLRILLVEDHDDNRALLRAYLRRTPYQIDEAADGQVALDRFFAGQYDLVLMDMELPVVDGYGAVVAMREWERGKAAAATPILALTAHARQVDFQRSLDVGCDGHLSKPIRRGALLEAIRAWTERSGGVSKSPVDTAVVGNGSIDS